MQTPKFVGQRLGVFEILSLLGAGPSTSVWSGR